jgi:CheY-like chemotaxis protein
LLVDDDKDVLNSLRRLLRRDNHDVLVATSGSEAIQTLAATEVAVIVCDHNMPGMNGAECLAAARNLQPETVRITLTASANLETARLDQRRTDQSFLAQTVGRRSTSVGGARGGASLRNGT